MADYGKILSIWEVNYIAFRFILYQIDPEPSELPKRFVIWYSNNIIVKIIFRHSRFLTLALIRNRYYPYPQTPNCHLVGFFVCRQLYHSQWVWIVAWWYLVLIKPSLVEEIKYFGSHLGFWRPSWIWMQGKDN